MRQLRITSPQHILHALVMISSKLEMAKQLCILHTIKSDIWCLKLVYSGGIRWFDRWYRYLCIFYQTKSLLTMAMHLEETLTREWKFENFPNFNFLLCKWSLWIQSVNMMFGSIFCVHIGIHAGTHRLCELNFIENSISKFCLLVLAK